MANMVSDNEYFTRYNANPWDRKTTDCVIRALSTIFNVDYTQIVMDVANFQCECGYDISDTRGLDLYLKQRGWVKMKQPRKSDNTKYTGREFVKIFKGVCIANIGCGHVVAIANGKVLDTWDSSRGCIGNYWVRER